MSKDPSIELRDLNPRDEEDFFRARLKQAQAGLETATDEAAARHCRYLISRYQAVLKLYRSAPETQSKPH